MSSMVFFFSFPHNWKPKNAFEVVGPITQIFQYVKIHIVQQIFRTDLISAMKLPDHQNLSPDNYITISDPWRQEWERGVQEMS